MHKSATLEKKEIIDLGLLWGGEIHPGSDGKRDLFSPADGRKIASIACASGEDVNKAVMTVHKGYLKWRSRTAMDREKIIRTATAYVREQADKIGRLMALEQGKPFNQSRSEVLGSCDTLDYFAAEGVRLEGYISPTEAADIESKVVYESVGVCALITPWNYPVALLSWKLGPALATGCGVVVKPTSTTPMSPHAFCQALVEGGIPADIIAVVTGAGKTVGETLLRHPKVEKVAMTGSTATGKRLMEVVGPQLKKISLELGGHCPAIVCEDADLDLAAKIIAYKGFRNMGQSCSSINRVYAHHSIHDTLVQKLKAIAESLRIGDGVSDGSVDLGPMADEGGVKTTKEHIGDALEKGAKLVCGGKAPEGEEYAKGNYFLPTILTGANPDMIVMKEETFGPIVPFASYENIDDAIAAANDTTYGLVAYLFARDYGRITTVSKQLEAGTICVNNGAVNTNYGPYAGWKESGYGLELSRRAIFEYVNTKHIKIKIG
jgi:acyl-CoA reductase-like NAD-dependent aldehyde dehydrogenase